MPGIYKIINLINGKVYIGQAKNVKERFSEHRQDLRKNKHINKHLQHSWNKYSENNFKFEVIEECEEDRLTEREQYWIDYYGGLNSTNNYNQKDAGSSGTFSLEVRQKMSERLKGCEPWNKGLKGCFSEETLQKMRNKKLSDETKEKIRQSTIGKIISIETRKKLSKAHKGKPKTPFSEKHLENLSIAHLGQTAWNKGIKNKYIWVKKDNICKHILLDELEKYLQEGYERGRIVNWEAWNKGIPMSEETKKKLSTSLKGRTYKKRNK